VGDVGDCGTGAVNRPGQVRIEADGYLTIVDRKKEIIINSPGKNMSSANIEATVKSGSPLIGQAVHRRPPSSPRR
jgi:long-subunit acyl-CoA synthetase (AMP-forming)